VRAVAHQLVVGEESDLDQPLHTPPVEGAKTSRQVAEAEQGAPAHASASVPGKLGAGPLGPGSIFGLERHLDHQLLELDRVVALERLPFSEAKVSMTRRPSS